MSLSGGARRIIYIDHDEESDRDEEEDDDEESEEVDEDEEDDDEDDQDDDNDDSDVNEDDEEEEEDDEAEDEAEDEGDDENGNDPAELSLAELIDHARDESYAIPILSRHGDIEEQRLEEIREFRTSSPLFMEDHDFYYRLIAFNGSQFPAGSDAANFFIGPTKHSSAVSLKLHLLDTTSTEQQPAVADSLRDHYTCCICLNLMFDPTTLPCGHSGCLTCMKNALIQGNNGGGGNRRKCPMCQSKVRLDPHNEMEVSVILRTTMQQLFPQEYGKKEYEPIDIDIKTIGEAIHQQFGLSKSLFGNSVVASMPTQYNLVMKENNTIFQSFTISSQCLAYRILKDHSLIMQRAHISTVVARRLLHEQISTITPQNRLQVEPCSKLPRPLFTLLTSVSTCGTNNYYHDTDLYDTFIKFLQSCDTKGSGSSSSSSSTGSTMYRYLPYGDGRVALKRYLPDHQLRQCYRRATILFEETSNNNNTDINVDVRKLVVEKVLNPLLRMIDEIAPDTNYLNREEIAGTPTKLVLVDDALKAWNTSVPSTTLPIHEVYGFGVPGVPRGLLAPALISILGILNPSNKSGIDEIALSVVHDMIVTFAIKIVKHAQRYAKQLPLNSSYLDRKTKTMVRNEQLELDAFSVVMKNSSSHQQMAKKGRSLTLKGIAPRRQAWTSFIYHQFPATDDSDDGHSRKREASMLDDYNEGDGDIDTTMGSIITLEDIKRAVSACIKDAGLREHALTETNIAGKCKIFCDEITAGMILGSSLGDDCGLAIAPPLVFFMLQGLSEFKHRGSISMTIEALIGLTKVMEYIAAEILEISSKECNKLIDEQCISPRHISNAFLGDEGLYGLFYGIIRNGGARLHGHFPDMPDSVDDGEYDNDAVQAQYETFDEKLQDTYGEDNGHRAFIHPLTGTLCSYYADYYLDDNEEICNEFVDVATLEVLSKFTEPLYAEIVQVNNIFRRKAHAIQCLSDEDRHAFDELITPRYALWMIRCREMTAAQHNWLPIFDKEAIHSLCCSLYASNMNSKVSLRLSVEACEFIGCLIENFIVELVSHSRQCAGVVEDMKYILRRGDLVNAVKLFCR